ncbi:hypothetical protein EJ05DRAFT_7422 [Pseudovirgaria hyperparasitica]|uniref:Uncharacterized protein n=1 Tax=Pseudovirgaria hyperparasitica TaxID=470096 RepID=A0A6A6WKC8_9PEZI|nr:uncharacterized protein EJ05DRAFT_7422 [Pseudovirgaria hyperparasitica]KAF2762603.1 hypothetical protein EJ05DRAFT_7422 [Pseudovirgaria hyperparasitica]
MAYAVRLQLHCNGIRRICTGISVLTPHAYCTGPKCRNWMFRLPPCLPLSEAPPRVYYYTVPDARRCICAAPWMCRRHACMHAYWTRENGADGMRGRLGI